MFIELKQANQLHSAADVREALLACAYEIHLRVKHSGDSMTPEAVEAEVEQLAKTYCTRANDSAINLCAVLPEIRTIDTEDALAELIAMGDALSDDNQDDPDFDEVEAAAIEAWGTLLCDILDRMGLETP